MSVRGADARALEVVLGEHTVEDVDALEIGGSTVVTVFVPLDSVGSTNSYVDICDDYAEAIWAGEKLATQAGSAVAEEDDRADTWTNRIRLTLQSPRLGLKAALRECALLYDRYEDNDNTQVVDEYMRVRMAALDFADGLGSYSPVLPDIFDAYFANLINGAYHEMRGEMDDRLQADLAEHPERRVGYWRSGYCSRLGAICYASAEGWLLPSRVNLDHFFRMTGQRYELSSFLPGSVLTIDSASYVVTEAMAAFFPMGQYFRSRACGSFATGEDDDYWSSDAFDWIDASFTISPHLEDMQAGMPEGIDLRRPRVGTCLVDPDATLVIVSDGRFNHLLYDTKPLTLEGLKSLLNAVGDLSSVIATGVGLSADLACDWSSLSDEEFERLCYDLIYAHPRFDASTIRKHGKSRSRDGGRDIEVMELARRPGARARKWVFQCKLVKGASSLSGARLVDVGDMLDHYRVEGFGVMTSAPIDATLYDKLDAICGKRGVEQLNFSVLELERALARNDTVRRRYFGT